MTTYLTPNGGSAAVPQIDTTTQLLGGAGGPMNLQAQAVLNAMLMAWAFVQAFQLVSATRDANGAITTASIVWPDGATGTFTTDTASTAFLGAIDAWHATYVNGAVTKTVTQTAVTRDANGAVTAQPAITIS